MPPRCETPKCGLPARYRVLGQLACAGHTAALLDSALAKGERPKAEALLADGFSKRSDGDGLERLLAEGG